VGLWLALEDATLDNGCMWAAPGVHKAGVARRFVHRNGRMTFEGEMPAVDPAAFVPLPVPAGSLVLLHGANQHYRWVGARPFPSFALFPPGGRCQRLASRPSSAGRA
jgi:phytanoyl-CoA hydroxylase